MRRSKQLVDLTGGVKPVEFSSEETRQLEDAAGRLDKELGMAEERSEYGGQFMSELPGKPVSMLHVDDFSVISHITGVRGLVGYPSRAFTRVHEGDIVAGTFDPIPGYSEYLTERLQMGRAEYIQVKKPSQKPAYATFAGLLEDSKVRACLMDRVDKVGWPLVVHPYMGLREAWQAARELAIESTQEVRVLAPLPTVTERANNKAWFHQVVELVCGKARALDVSAASSVDELTRRVERFAGKYEELVVKLSDSASGMGTKIYRSDELRRLSQSSLREQIVRWAQEKEWDEKVAPPVSIEQWQTGVTGSPSIQLWIPPRSEGTPLVEGIFDQRFVEGSPELVFEGSVPSEEPDEVKLVLARLGSMLGYVFQLLGYVGRCSFDTVIGEEEGKAFIKFTECNARWGGTSTPMTFMNLLFGDYRKQPYVASDYINEKLTGVTFLQLVGLLKDILYDARTGKGWVILYNVGPLESDGKLDVITTGSTLNQAEERQSEFDRITEKHFLS